MESAVLVVLPELQPLVGPWRERGGPTGPPVPASVVLLHPFLPPDRLDVGVRAELEWFFSHVDAFDVAFAGAVETGGAVELDPEGTALDDLAAAVARRWPEAPPYGGVEPRPRARVTVLRSDDAALRAQACQEVAPALPVTARVATASLWRSDATGAWSQQAAFPLAEG